MSLLVLSDEIMRRVISYLPSFPVPRPHPWIGPDDHTPLLELDANLQSLCAANRSLRKLCMPLLYGSVVLNLERHALGMQRVVLLGGILSEPEVSQYVRHVRIHDSKQPWNAYHWTHLWCAYLRTMGDESLYGLADESSAMFLQIIRNLLDSLPNLITIDAERTDVSLDEDIVNAIHGHPSLHEIRLESFRQFGNLSVEFLSSTPMSRIRVRGLIIDEQQHPMPAIHRTEMLQACARPDGPRISELVVGWFTDPTWVGLTFNGLRDVRLSVYELTARHFIPTACASFFERHNEGTGLESVQISGDGVKDLSLLENVPCVSLLREVAIAHGYEGTFWLDNVHVQRSKGGRREPADSEGEWYLKRISVVFKERTEEVLPFVLDCLPPCESLSLSKPSDDDEDWIAFSTTYSILLSHTPNLQLTHHLSLSQFPLWDTPPDHPIPFGYCDPDPDEDEDEDDDDEYDEPTLDELMDILSPLGVALEPQVRELANTCKRLGGVNFAGPRGFEVGDHFFEYLVHGRSGGAGDNGEEGNVEDDGDDGDDEEGEELNIEWGIPMYK